MFATALAVLLLAAVAGACIAVAVRFGDHPAYARAVVDFSRGTIGMRNVEATDPNPFDGFAALRVSRAGIGTRVAIARGVGVTVRISARTGALQITLVGARHRFKYLSYAVISGDRLVIDLWKSRPPSRTAEIRRGPAGCLALLKSSVSAGLVTASGRARRVFENQFPLVLRRSDGTVIAQRTMHVSGGRWSGQLTYHTTRTQAATLEAVETSAKDGALICIVQIRITLPASPAVAVKAYKPTAMGSYQGGVSLVGWSPDGRYVSTRLGNVWTSVGASAGKLFATRAIGTWTWSPASDCALAVTATAQRGHHRRSRWALPVNPPARI